MQFQELTMIFWIWMLIVIFLVAVAVPLYCQHEVLNFTGHVLSLVKVILEQGDPFQNTIIEEARLWSVTGSFLLMGIVLSNAYKSTSVYNIIIPHMPVPYQNFSELIYTASIYDLHKNGLVRI